MRRWGMKSDVLDSSETGGAAPLLRGSFFLLPLSAIERVEAQGLLAAGIELLGIRY